jgi:hypothetical protein
LPLLKICAEVVIVGASAASPKKKVVLCMSGPPARHKGLASSNTITSPNLLADFKPIVPSPDIVDRLFYAAIPLLGYVLLLLAAFFLLRQSDAGLEVLAAAQITLLLAGIRNAWDMMMWIVIRVPTTEVGGRDGPD